MDNTLTTRSFGDALSIKSNFATSMISKLIGKFVKKQGYEAEVRIGEMTMSHSDSDGLVKVHLDLYVTTTERDIHKLISKL